MKDNYIFTYDKLYIQDKKFSDILILNLQKESDNKSFIENKQFRSIYRKGNMNQHTFEAKLEYLKDLGYIEGVDNGIVLHLEAFIGKRSNCKVIISKREGDILLESKENGIIKLYSILLSLNRNDKECILTLSKLCELIGITRQTSSYAKIKRQLSILQEEGLISYELEDNKYRLTSISHESYISEPPISLGKEEEFYSSQYVYVPITDKFRITLPLYSDRIYAWIQLNGETNNKILRIDTDKLEKSYKEFKTSKAELKKHIDILYNSGCITKIDFENNYYIIDYRILKLSGLIKISKNRAELLLNENKGKLFTLYSYLCWEYIIKRRNKDTFTFTLSDLARKIGLSDSKSNFNHIRLSLEALSNLKLLKYICVKRKENNVFCTKYIVNDITLPSQKY